MIGLILAIFIANILAYKNKSRLTANQVVHIWAFTMALEMAFDIYVDLKLHAYWYFAKYKIEWASILPHIFLVPAVNILFINYYPLRKPFGKQLRYFIYWTLGILLYEKMTMIPEPWGYFHYGWWTIWHSVALDPILLLILLMYFKWIRKVEHK